MKEEMVIVGGGIGGLATALALHRKGFQNVAVYERSESLRTEGTAILIQPNGWRALDELGVGNQLRDKAILLQGLEDVWIDKGRRRKSPYLNGEFRCLKRSDLLNALANALPPETIRFGCNVLSVRLDPRTMSPVLQLNDDKAVQAKVLIGCDGSNSKVASFLGLKPASAHSICSVRGFTNYPDGHSFPPLNVRTRDGGDGFLGVLPINDKLVYWYVSVPLSCRADGKLRDDPELIKQVSLRAIKSYAADEIELIEKCELDSLSLTRLRYRHPWEILVGKFHKGSVAVLGDAMHPMGPFLGQGGAAALEDAVVLARNLQLKGEKKIEEALDQYVKERRLRIARLTTQSYLIGTILGSTSSVVKFIAIIIMIVFFRDPIGHAKYNCGKL